MSTTLGTASERETLVARLEDLQALLGEPCTVDDRMEARQLAFNLIVYLRLRRSGTTQNAAGEHPAVEHFMNAIEIIGRNGPRSIARLRLTDAVAALSAVPTPSDEAVIVTGPVPPRWTAPVQDTAAGGDEVREALERVVWANDHAPLARPDAFSKARAVLRRVRPVAAGGREPDGWTRAGHREGVADGLLQAVLVTARRMDVDDTPVYFGSPAVETGEVRSALRGLVKVIDAGGLEIPSRGVQHGGHAWLAKLVSAMTAARAALGERVDTPEVQS